MSIWIPNSHRQYMARMNRDRSQLAKGCAFGLILSALIWSAIIALILWLT